MSLLRCSSQNESTCKQLGSVAFAQKSYKAPDNELIYKFRWINKAIIQDKMLNIYGKLSKFTSSLEFCNKDVQDSELKKYIDFLRSKLETPIERQFEYLSVDSFDQLLSNSLDAVDENKLNLANDQNVPVRLIIWHYPKPKPIFTQKDGSLRFSLEGLKQNLLGKRYGHSALLVGKQTPEGYPVPNESYYLSYPYGNDYEFDLKKYKEFTIIDLPKVSDKSYAEFKKTMYYSTFGDSYPNERFQELVDKRTELKNKIAEKIGIAENKISDFFKKHKSKYRTKFPGYKKNPLADEVNKQKQIIDLLDEYYLNQLKISRIFKLFPEEKSHYQGVLENQRKKIHEILGFDDGVFLEEMIDSLEDTIRKKPEIVPEGVTKNTVLVNAMWVKRKREGNLGRKKEFVDAYNEFVEAKGILAMKELAYGDDFSFKGRNCSCATGVGMETLYKRTNLYRKRFAPPDPLDNLKRANNMKAQMEGSLGYKIRKVGGLLGISSILASAAWGAYYLNSEYEVFSKQKIEGNDLSLTTKASGNVSECVSKAFTEASQLFSEFRLDINTQMTELILNRR